MPTEMPKGYRTPEDKRQKTIALAATDLTQEEIAKDVGLSRRTLARIWAQEGIQRSTGHTLAGSSGHKTRLQGEELTIQFDPSSLNDLGVKTLDGKPWQVACVRAVNVGKTVAKGCWATLILASGATVTGSRGPFYLNPVDPPYSLQRDTAVTVDVPPHQHGSWDLVFAPPSEAPSVAITSGPIYATLVPADVRGVPPPEMDWHLGGACIGIPIAMTRRGVPQAHLIPGEYEATLEVGNEQGLQTAARLSITSPHNGGILKVTMLDPGNSLSVTARRSRRDHVGSEAGSPEVR